MIFTLFFFLPEFIFLKRMRVVNKKSRTDTGSWKKIVGDWWKCTEEAMLCLTNFNLLCLCESTERSHKKLWTLTLKAINGHERDLQVIKCLISNKTSYYVIYYFKLTSFQKAKFTYLQSYFDCNNYPNSRPTIKLKVKDDLLHKKEGFLVVVMPGGNLVGISGLKFPTLLGTS